MTEQNNSTTQPQTKSAFIKGEESFVNTTGLHLPMKYMSISQVNCYSLCPRSYYWRYIEKKKEKSSAKLIVGSLGHRVLELMAEMDQMDFSQRELSDLFRMVFNLQVEDEYIEKTQDFMAEVDKEMDSLVGSLAYYYKNVFTRTNFMTQEIQVDAPVPITKMDLSHRGTPGLVSLGDITVVGFLDFINHTSKTIPFKERIKGERYDPKIVADPHLLEIGDYKTGAPKDHTHFVGDIQMPFYSYVTGIQKVRIDNILPSRIKFNKDGGPRKDNIYPGCNIMRYDVQGADVNNSLEQISHAAVGIGSGAFPMCHPSIWKCSADNCGFWSICRGAREKHFEEKVAQEKLQDIVKTGM